MVPVFTIAYESHGEFNENTHALYTKQAMASVKRVRKKRRLRRLRFDFDVSFGVTLGVKKEKGQRLNTSDLRF